MRRGAGILFVCLLAAGASFGPFPAGSAQSGLEAAADAAPALPGGGSGVPGAAGAGRGDMADIHDIRPLRPPGPDLRPLAFGLLALGGVLVAILAAHLWRRRRRRLRDGITPALSPDAAALAALDGLSDTGGVDVRWFYFRLSAVLRRYLRERFGIPASEMTLEELLPELDRLGLRRERASQLKDRLSAAEHVKYAGRSVGEDRMREDLDFARALIRETAPADDDASGGRPEAPG
jgi:hypothetical protein